VGFVVDKVALGRFFPKHFGFTLSISFHRFSFIRKTKKLIIFITGLHNKPQGCGASVASAAGPFNKKRIQQDWGDARLDASHKTASFGIKIPI
jgi:hypothetical protein